jgi:hypothetical protein
MKLTWAFSRLAAPAATVGLAVTACGTGGTSRHITVTVVNDSRRTVELQPSCGVVCRPFEPVALSPGESHTWHTIDREPGIQSFGVNIPHSRSLGCLRQHGAYRVGDSVTFRVSKLDECVT